MNAAPNQELVAHYEQLRHDALSFSAGRTPAPGLALFLRQGMTAWMQAWTPCMQEPCAETQPPSAITQPYAFDVRAQITTILAGIILTKQREATR
jgi:hypothetical protein